MSKEPQSAAAYCECGELDTGYIDFKTARRLAQEHADKTGHVVTLEVSYNVYSNKENQ